MRGNFDMLMDGTLRYLVIGAVLTIGALSCNEAPRVTAEWPTVTRETKPWTRWWWHGSAVTKEGITAELEAYSKAGLGGVEITPIYGVYGEEDSFIQYLSPQWLEMLDHTLREAARLGLGVDMATGTGWPFGGPWVSAEDACKNMNFSVHALEEGESLREPLIFHQEPYVRAVGTQVYEMHGIYKVPGEQAQGSIAEPLMKRDVKPLNIEQLIEPVEANSNLQALALDQVKFDKQLTPSVIMAYSADGEVVNLTSKVDTAGMLNWIAPPGSWQVYAIFPGAHGKMVERAAPGGEGNVIDHFSEKALNNYLHRFDSAFSGRSLDGLRAFFNDSYEVDDARGTADWTPKLFEQFLQRRDYDLREHLPALFGHASEEENQRVLCDYRETLSELVHDNFTAVWRAWAKDKGKIVRNQAHGAPANILDLYAAVDIPETEGTEPLRIKMASSAAHVSGKPLISSESATWLDEHFLSSLAEIKASVDLLMTGGVNHIFYHGSCYSPPGDPWPGRLFYAAVHLNPRNPMWEDFGKLNAYVTRSQSFLQKSKPANDVLLYYPIYDRFSTPGREMLEHFDGIGEQFDSTAFKDAAEMMLEQGYTYDYISDKQIRTLEVSDGKLVTEGEHLYQTIVVPHCKYIPVATLRALLSLADDGATIIMYKGMPETFSGYEKREENGKAFSTLMSDLAFAADGSRGMERAEPGSGAVFRGDDLEALLAETGVRREELTEKGLSFIRKRNEKGFLYFITNWSANDFDGTVRLSAPARSAMLFDPMFGRAGVAQVRQEDEDDPLSVRLQLRYGETIIVQTSERAVRGEAFPYIATSGERFTVEGPWQLTFVKGVPALPPSATMNTLRSWTLLPDVGSSNFSGTARYMATFQVPEAWEGDVQLDLGTVKETSRVLVNGHYVATLIGPRFTVTIDRELLTGNDTLAIEVSNLMANAIADLDRRGINWKRFYNVNFPARLEVNRKNGLFDASEWLPLESGLLGPVTLAPLSSQQPGSPL